MKITVDTTIIDGAVIEQLVKAECDRHDPLRDHIAAATKFICDTRDAQVRAALVHLGWTPPPDPA